MYIYALLMVIALLLMFASIISMSLAPTPIAAIVFILTTIVGYLSAAKVSDYE